MKTQPLFFAFLFLILLRSSYTSQAQQVFFKRALLPEGSYFGIINGITQDPDGYMWFVAYARGLHRYDGYRVVTYLNDPSNPHSLVSNDLEAIYADHNGIIWIGTQESGLDRLDPATGIFTHFRNKKNDSTSLTDDRVTAILEDHEGILWVGTMNGLNKLNKETGTFIRYVHDPKDSKSLSCSKVQVLYEDRRNTVWAGTAAGDKNNTSVKEGGLNRFDRKTGAFTQYLYNPKDSSTLTDNRVGAIFEDSKGNFWISTAGDGLHTMDRERGTFQRYRYDPAHPEKLSGPPRKKEIGLDLNLFFICEDAAEAIWMGSSGGWITRYDLNTKRSTHYSSFNEDAQAMDAVSGAFNSREGIFWITTWIGTIYHVNSCQRTIQHFTTGNISHSIREDASGKIWIGTFGQGLIQHDRNKASIRRFVSEPSSPFTLNDLFIDAIYEASDSTLWIGSEKGLHGYNRKTKIFIHYKNDLSNSGVQDILEDKPGSLWLATRKGLLHFDVKSGVFTHYPTPQDNTSQYYKAIISLVKDHEGNIWMGKDNGVLDFFDPQNGKFKHFTCGSGQIGCIAEDFQHIIWVGTSNGLYRSNAAVDSFTLFTDQRVVMTPVTVITTILEDNQKNLWIASSSGILRIAPSSDQISVYNTSCGIDATGLTFYIMRGSKSNRGEFFFADKTGYYSFFPGYFRSNIIPPQIVLSDFRLADVIVKPGEGSVLKTRITQTKEIMLKYNQNNFSFDFAAIHFGSPQDNQHFFMLENLDKTWRKAGTEKTAYYYNVLPGRYIFRVKATNSDGVWAEKNIIVNVALPWWRTWWFIVIALVSSGTFFYILVSWRLQQKFKLKLERSEKEKQLADMRHKTTELEMQALRAQMNPHFIFNCLNAINGFILTNEPETAANYLTKFSRLIRLVLNNSQKRIISLEEELETLGLYLHMERLRFTNSFHYRINCDDTIDALSIFIPPMLLQPFVENAIWHGLLHKEGNGELFINLHRAHDTLHCTITDNGIGRKKAMMLKSKSAEKNKSMGLQITKNRLALLNQDLNGENFFEIQDTQDASGNITGTTVSLKIKIKEAIEENIPQNTW